MFLKLADKIEKCFESPVEHFRVKTNEKSIFTLPTDQTEVCQLLDKFSKSNVKGYDFMSNRMLSRTAPVLAQSVM